MDTLVLPSRTTPNWVEFFGRVLIEAMSCGVPVIGSDSGEIPKVIGTAGLVFPEEKTEILAQHLKAIYQDQSLRQQLIQRGLERVHQFTWETIADNTFRTYANLLSE